MVYDEYDSVIARMYDADYAAVRDGSGDIDLYVEEARRSGGPVLEIGCGTGRILIPTAEAGVEIVGLDFSAAMLEQLKAKRPDAVVHQGDMRAFDLGRRFALVTIPFRALSHILEAEEHVRVFENVRRHLAPGGRVIFDLFQADPKLIVEPWGGLQLERETEDDGGKVRRYHEAVPHRARQVTDVTFRWEIESASGEIEQLRSHFPMRWFYPFEVEHILARAGLEIEEVWGGCDRSPLEDDSPEMIFVAKPAGA